MHFDKNDLLGGVPNQYVALGEFGPSFVIILIAEDWEDDPETRISNTAQIFRFLL